MKIRITIKHITLAVGILVAALVVVMFLVNRSTPLESHQAITLPSFSISRSVPAVIQVLEIFF
jgi:hypothetical protein